MIRNVVRSAMLLAALAVSAPAAAVTINLTVSGGGIDSSNTRTCTSVTCGTAVWSLASGEEYAATGTITIDTTLLTMTINLAVATSVIDSNGTQAATDGGASALEFTGGVYTATVPITLNGITGAWDIAAGQVGSVSFSLVEAVGAGAGAPLSFATTRVTGGCLLDVNNTGQCGIAFGAAGATPFLVSGAGFGSYSRHVRHQFNVDVVPEPSTLVLLGLGLVGFAGLARAPRR